MPFSTNTPLRFNQDTRTLCIQPCSQVCELIFRFLYFDCSHFVVQSTKKRVRTCPCRRIPRMIANRCGTNDSARNPKLPYWHTTALQLSIGFKQRGVFFFKWLPSTTQPLNSGYPPSHASRSTTGMKCAREVPKYALNSTCSLLDTFLDVSCDIKNITARREGIE